MSLIIILSLICVILFSGYLIKFITKIVGLIIGGIILVAIIIMLIMHFHNTTPPEPKNTSNENNTNTTNTTTNVGQQKKYYNFADYPDGKVIVYLGSEATFYPVGGEIKIETPSRRINTLRPGQKIVFPSENAGDFTFSANEKSATGVDVWQ